MMNPSNYNNMMNNQNNYMVRNTSFVPSDNKNNIRINDGVQLHNEMNIVYPNGEQLKKKKEKKKKNIN